MKKSSHYLLTAYVPRFNPNFDMILSELGIVCTVSSLHDSELSSYGRYVLPHYHVLLKFPKPVFDDTVKFLAHDLGLTFVRSVCSANLITLNKFFDFTGGNYVKETRKPL